MSRMVCRRKSNTSSSTQRLRSVNAGHYILNRKKDSQDWKRTKAMHSPETDSQDGPSTRGPSPRLRDLSAQQWKSGAAAWLGWLFDGLDMHLYVLVATPFVAELLQVANPKDEQVGYYSSWIQAAFLIGWALGGSLFGLAGDRFGRSRTLML